MKLSLQPLGESFCRELRIDETDPAMLMAGCQICEPGPYKRRSVSLQSALEIDRMRCFVDPLLIWL